MPRSFRARHRQPCHCIEPRRLFDISATSARLLIRQAGAKPVLSEPTGAQAMRGGNWSCTPAAGVQWVWVSSHP